MTSAGTQTYETVDSHIAPVVIRGGVPDHPTGDRFCKVCQDWRPIDKFASGKRRFCCKSHRWERFGKQSKITYMKSGENKLLSKLWLKSYADSRVFNPVCETGSSRVHISHKEIKKILYCMVTKFKLTSSLCSMYKDLEDLGRNVALVPLLPNEKLSISNFALVSSGIKRKILKAFRQGGVEEYVRTLNEAAETKEFSVFTPSEVEFCEMKEALTSTDKPLFS